MNQEELKTYCIKEIARLRGEVTIYQSAINLRMGGIESYEDIIRQIDGVPDPGTSDEPSNGHLDRAGAAHN